MLLFCVKCLLATQCLKSCVIEAGEMAEWVGVPAAPAEDPGFVLNTRTGRGSYLPVIPDPGPEI